MSAKGAPQTRRQMVRSIAVDHHANRRCGMQQNSSDTAHGNTLYVRLRKLSRTLPGIVTVTFFTYRTTGQHNHVTSFTSPMIRSINFSRQCSATRHTKYNNKLCPAKNGATREQTVTSPPVRRAIKVYLRPVAAQRPIVCGTHTTVISTSSAALPLIIVATIGVAIIIIRVTEAYEGVRHYRRPDKMHNTSRRAAYGTRETSMFSIQRGKVEKLYILKYTYTSYSTRNANDAHER